MNNSKYTDKHNMASEKFPVVPASRNLEISPVQHEQIPAELRSYPQWVCWRYVDRGPDKKPDKQPVNPRTLHNAGVRWENTWTSFEQAYEAYLRYSQQGLNGIGFVLTLDDPYVAVDIDECIDDAGMDEDAAKVISTLNSYTEISPSGHGLRILVTCAGFQENSRKQALEIYSHHRYVTITGNCLSSTSSAVAQVGPDMISALIPQSPRIENAPKTVEDNPPKYTASNDVLWQRIFAHDKYGAHHLRRFQGDINMDGGDHSFTVIRLLNCLARWTRCNPIQMREMMLMSPLVNEKWLTKRGEGDWLDHQIADAIAYVGMKGK